MPNPTAASLYGIGVGTASTAPLLPFISQRAPTTRDISGPNGAFQVGQRWIDETNYNSYVLVDLYTSAGLVQGAWIAEGGTASGVQQLASDSGTASPSLGVITLAGSAPISTSATGSTVTIASVAVDSVTCNTGSAAPSSNTISIVGTAPLSTTGSGSTVTVAHGGPEIVQTWVPNLSFGGASVGITYDVQTGSYLQIGPVVFFTAFINLSSKGSSVGAASITNMPVVGGASFTQYVGTVDFWSLITLDANFTEVTWQFNSTTILFYEAGSGQTMTQLANTHFADDTTFKITGYYMTN